MFIHSQFKEKSHREVAQEEHFRLAQRERVRTGSLREWFQSGFKEEYDQVERRAGVWERLIWSGHEEPLKIFSSQRLSSA